MRTKTLAVSLFWEMQGGDQLLSDVKSRKASQSGEEAGPASSAAGLESDAAG